jgi:hypothetical protein
MEAVRDAWTDPRLDDLNQRVDSGFKETSREFQALRLEMRTEFSGVRSEMHTEFAAVRSEMHTEFAAVRSEMHTEFAAVRSETAAESTSIRGEIAGLRTEMAAMNRTLIQVGAGAMVTMFVGFAATIATVLTQT